MPLNISLYKNLKRKVDLYLSVKQYDPSVELLENKLSLYPNDLELMKLLAAVYFFQNKTDKTLELLEKCQQKEPTEKETQLLLVAVFCDLGEYQKAQELYKKIQRSPYGLLNRTLATERLMQDYILCGLTFYKSNNFSRAIVQFSQALTLRPDSLEAGIYLAKAQIKLKDFQKAYITLKGFCKKYPNSFDVHLWLGVVYYQLAKLNLANFHISKARDINSEDRVVGLYLNLLESAQRPATKS